MRIESLTASQERKILVCAYNGIGDALICGPILRSLNKLYSGRILYPANPVLTLYKDLGIENLNDIGTVGRELRRLVDFAPENLLEILHRENIGVIFNLRHDRLKDNRYESLANQINRAGIFLSDVCRFDSPGRQTELHFFDLLRSYFEQLGITVETYREGWLRDSIRSSDWIPIPNSGVGVFLGAGHIIKRMTPAFWQRLIKLIHNRMEAPLTLMCGSSHDEILQGQELSNELKEGGIPHRLISGLSLFDLTRMVVGFDLIVSCDTFMVHLAEALGVEVVGIYCSTNPTVYGPYLKQNQFVMSSFYSQCPLHNDWANCDGWDIGCADTPCKDFVQVDKVASHILKSLSLPRTQSLEG